MFQIIGNHGLPIFQGNFTQIATWVASNGLGFVARIVAI